MSNNLRLSVFLIAMILYLVVFVIFKRGRIPFKYLLVWFIPLTIILVVSIFPNTLISLTHLLGFLTVSNMVIGMLIVVLLSILISFSIVIAGQTTKIQLLIQELSILKKEIKEMQIVGGADENE